MQSDEDYGYVPEGSVTKAYMIEAGLMAGILFCGLCMILGLIDVAQAVVDFFS